MNTAASLHRHIKLQLMLALLLVATTAGAMPIHIANVFPAREAEPMRIDVAIGRNIVARNLDYRDVVTVDGWPGPNMLTVYRAGTNAAVASGFIVPPPSAPVAALERGYVALITADPGNDVPRIVVADEAPVSGAAQAGPLSGPVYVTFAAPLANLLSSQATISTECIEITANGESRRRTRVTVDARVGRSHGVIANLDPFARCGVVIEFRGRQPLVVSDIEPAPGRTVRIVVVGDGARRPLETLVLDGGNPQPPRRGPDPLASIRADTLWVDADRPSIAYIGGDPVRTGTEVGFLLLADGAGQARWLLLVMADPSAEGEREVTVFNATRPVGELAATSVVGRGTSRMSGCNRYELELVIDETSARYIFERSVPRPDCAAP